MYLALLIYYSWTFGLALLRLIRERERDVAELVKRDLASKQSFAQPIDVISKIIDDFPLHTGRA